MARQTQRSSTPSGLICCCLCLCAIQPLTAGSYQELAERLAEQIEASVPVRVGIGEFVYEDTLQQSAYSSLLREELETALAGTRRFEIITRDRIADLQVEADFQRKSYVGADAEAGKLEIAGVEGIVRGRFFYNYPDVTIFAELAWLENGKVNKARVTLPVKDAGAQLFPASLPLGETTAAERIRPQNLQKGQANVADVAQRVKEVPQDFALDLAVAEGKHDFAAGESVSFKVTPEQSCHVSVVVHQSDGSSVLLFPNAYNRNTWVEAGQTVQVPGTRKSGFEIVIGAPFGADVVQVIACTRKTELHRLLDRELQQNPGVVFRGVSRGMFTQAVKSSVGATPEDGMGAPRWASEYLIVSTYPKF